MQYLMVGLALALFYLLLLALSEHLSFDLAYGVSAGALVALITVYLTGALRSLRLALGAGAGLATLYTHALLDPAVRGLLAAHGLAAAVRRARGADDRHAPRRLDECRAAPGSSGAGWESGESTIVPAEESGERLRTFPTRHHVLTRPWLASWRSTYCRMPPWR